MNKFITQYIKKRFGIDALNDKINQKNIQLVKLQKKVEALNTGIIKKNIQIKTLKDTLKMKLAAVSKLKLRLQYGQNSVQWNSTDAMDAFWSQDDNTSIYKNFGKNLAKYINQKIPEKEFSMFLDMGCGSGDVTVEILKSLECSHISAFDFSQSSISIATNKLKEFMKPLECRVQDIYTLEGQYDFILCTEVIEHLVKPDLALKQLLCAINPNGKIVITVPDGRVDQSPGHTNFWSIESFESFLITNIDKKLFSIEIEYVYFNKVNSEKSPIGNLACIITKTSD
jgi:2-polyprenyl-3-methyl-5-hydroxy-6-metoxy-1,4-benzoquinol methylase